MQEILIDFEVFKALTAMRLNERHSYNDVIRDFLNLDSLTDPMDAADILLEGDSISESTRAVGFLAARGFSTRGIFLPNGTILRATYKQVLHTAKIDAGRWLSENGKTQTSPSAAAKEITSTNVNGLRFWHAKRPTDLDWYRLDLLK